MSMLDVLGKNLPAGVVYQQADASGALREFEYEDPSIKVILRTAMADFDHSGEYRPHLGILSGRRPSSSDVGSAIWRKLMPGPCFGAYPRMRPWLNSPIDNKRPIDVFFAGTVDNYPEPIQQHRQKMVSPFLGRPSCEISYGRSVASTVYRRAMGQAKVALCPWGNGELTYRLYEAWHSGAVPVMPHTTWLNAWYGKLIPGVDYVACAPDGSDIEIVVRSVLREWGSQANVKFRTRLKAMATRLLSDEALQHWKSKLAERLQ